ncbi:hypothetical protein T235_12455 [Tannerella sp. oral taxon BU063 isolate Cell 8/11]|jgi:hypothetical protein|uniref:TIR domain-containing protein n=1 Tax=Tannerella sp. oral taxon BU063 isolate Cell 8/11 TaxID=1411915 RepID=W2CXP6_9BACT|nr:hypothetical protein T235_12455 [Tannerella sp. oral taxon BU063 isolate Cell 8/11]
MNKAYGEEQLRKLLMNPELSSGLYLLDTDLTDEDIEAYIRRNSSFQYVSGKLIPASKGNVFELLIVGLSHQCQDDSGVNFLRQQLMTADDCRRDVIIYSLTIQTLKHFSVGRKTVVHVLGKKDLSCIESEDLDIFDAALTYIDDTIVVISTRKNALILKDSPIVNKSLKKIEDIFMTSKLKKVYISYKHDENCSKALEAIKNGLKKNNIEYSIDVQDIKYRDDIVEYEKKIGTADRVIIFIIASYLKSIDCMFEMTEIFKKSDVKERVFPIVDITPISRNREGLEEIKDYWKEQRVKAFAQMQTEAGISDYIINELYKINAIIKTLDEFWNYIVHVNTGVFEKLLENDAALLMEEILKTIPDKTVELDERFIPTDETQPTMIRKTIQNGEKAVYVESNTGSININ